VIRNPLYPDPFAGGIAQSFRLIASDVEQHGHLVYEQHVRIGGETAEFPLKQSQSLTITFAATTFIAAAYQCASCTCFRSGLIQRKGTSINSESSAFRHSMGLTLGYRTQLKGNLNFS